MSEQFKRYDYEDPAAYGANGQIALMDRSKARPIAWMNDKDTAQLLVDLLNKHEDFQRMKAQVQLWLADPSNMEGIDYDD